MRIVKEWNANSTNNIVTIYGNSEESKPTVTVHDGSIFVETDTHDIYMYDETNTTWRKLQCPCQESAS